MHNKDESFYLTSLLQYYKIKSSLFYLIHLNNIALTNRFYAAEAFLRI